MVFTSTVFLFLFLPAFMAVYAVLPPRARTTWILIASYAFYAWWRPDFALLFAAATVVAYAVGESVARLKSSRRGTARVILTLGVTLQLSTLAYFKYAEFGVASLDALLRSLGAGPLPAVSIILPIGISFYVFQSISYMVDVWREDAPMSARFVDVAAYIALFPQLIAGPIVRYKHLALQLARPAMDGPMLAEGAQRFMLGFCKKVLIADALAPIADGAFALSSPTMVEAWIGTLAFAAQLFFDFSGYSDMAIGLGLLLGFRFKENFARPYLSASITEFWQRWHMSLSRWLRDYLYIPLGGNRLSPSRTYVNLLLVMVIGGLWHGASWVFVAWGAWHGALLAIERLQRDRGLRRTEEVSGLAARALTFTLVLVGWVLFRSTDLAHAGAVYAGMLGLNGITLSTELAWQLSTRSLVTLVIAYLLIFFPTPVPQPTTESTDTRPRPPAWQGRAERALTFALVPLFALGLMRAIADSFSPFLYFRF
ncbi:MAG: MBOAT family protein [Trueperaceae bacterium]|nr:MBOAT family protein [Trueperaceae bacterium]